ncbi:hypothetical protein Cob_v010530 [Colletotrichum orbiculare MAFF 240422]|uniref:Uncharacterized protein n=1 Tax=Colletotrichum orbiculare (strain 104-T / ATCC 96160 / CBS 514.97 / LARS 414 / MAFF 240422) TaxID=1213857 RepID=A0A484FI95_COLOR|nr:hypothetical protein Cob_v010530 [Colletotrichum orbiculare MAFF 240422]
MAHSELAPTSAIAAQVPGLVLSKDDSHQIQQYERILQFRDAILAGAHPKIKLPTHLAKHTPSASASSNPSTPAKETSGVTPQKAQAENLPPFASSTPVASSLPGLGNLPPTNANLPQRSFGSRSTEINPIFLEKSDDLIKAEIQLRRQRLERALRDEVDQRRASQKASSQSEPLVDLDLSDVLSKALTLVQATSSLPANITLAAANNSAASDSFDENSYYSSQHNSPDSSTRSYRVERGLGPASQAHLSSKPLQPPESESQTQRVQPDLPVSHPPSSAAHQPQGRAPTLMPARAQAVLDRPEPAPCDRSPSVGTTQRTQPGDTLGESTSGDRQQRRNDSLLVRQPSPLIQVRAPNISLVAPQPSHVSPLATAGAAAVGVQGMNISQGTTAQVAALRNQPNIISSPDSSPQGGRNGDRRKGKKKKNQNRKAARQAPEAEPYIKPEPRSPSPINAPSFVRPQKRQRRQVEDEPRYAQPERQPSRAYRDEGAASFYEGQDYRPRPASQMVMRDYGYARSYVDDTRAPSGTEFVRQVQSPGMYAVHAAPSEIYATSPASTERYREPARYYRDGYEVTRVSSRSHPDPERSRSPVMRERPSPQMGPPRAPPSRVVMDPVSGRRYFEPAGVVRPSVAPPPLRPGEPEMIYERPPVRAESRRPGLDPHDDEVLYQRTSPIYAAPRGVVTQPEYAASDPRRGHRQREYSTRPMVPPVEDFVQVRSGTERRVVEMPREYLMRATTARPPETERYDIAREYGRVQSVRPEQFPMQDYAAAPMHPEALRDVVQPGARSYSVRPAAEPHVLRREYSVRPAEHYQHYYGQPVPARGEAEVSYIERPRVAVPDVYYADELPRQYR